MDKLEILFNSRINYISEVYSYKDNKRILSPVTMGFKMSGDYESLSECEAYEMINEGI